MTATGDYIDVLYEAFRQKAESVSARVYRARDRAGAEGLAGGIIKESGAKKIAVAPSPMLDGFFSGSGNGLAVFTTELIRHAVEADAGVSEVDLAVSETGAIVQDATDIDKRLVSMLPPVHIALVSTANLVESADEALRRYRDRIPAYMAFITGPSRTADIERVLTIGVHGPGALHIIFVDG